MGTSTRNRMLLRPKLRLAREKCRRFCSPAVRRLAAGNGLFGLAGPGLVALIALVQAWTAAAAQAEEVRYYQQDGVTYRETRRTVTRPISETRYEQREQTVYREQLRTDTQQTTRTVYTPVTEYRWQMYLRGRWNPFVIPYHSYELVPTTRWETRQELVEIPTYRRELVPETHVVQMPVTTHRLAQEEVISRVAVSAAEAKPIGGVARLDKDPPRYGTTDWRASTGAVTRY